MATRAWLSEILQKGSIVDVSCHGGFNVREPLQSALFLADEECLTLGDLLSHTVDVRGLRLLILSACQTAIVDLQGAYDEVHSLAVGMVQAGARAVLATLWSVEEEATYLLLVRFVQEWLRHQERVSPKEALARAQLWLRTRTRYELQTWRSSDLPTRLMEEHIPAQAGWKAGAPDQSLGSTRCTEGVQEQHVHSDPDQMEPGEGERQAGRAEAMHRLQAWMYPSQNDDAHPYADPLYWAGFQLTGR